MDTIAYFNGHLPPLTQQFKKIIKKDLKREERKQRIRLEQLTQEQYKRALYLTTITQHYIEGYNECIDELTALGVLGKENKLVDTQKQLLKVQEIFLNETIKQGEESFMKRQNQQIKFQKFFHNIATANLDELYAIMNFAENVKHQKSKK